MTDLTVFCCLCLDSLHCFGLRLILMSICLFVCTVQLCVNNISMVICSLRDFKPLKCQLPRRLIIYTELYNFFVFRLCYGDIKLFEMVPVCFDPKLHFFESNRKNTKIRIKSSLKLHRKMHILLLLTPKLAL